ncbi:MAG: alpha/beta hydrolase [Pseudorhodoplanes sp.]|nr:alpha/beta hydrolase [Pseudorhodoplanes sp.]
MNFCQRRAGQSLAEPPATKISTPRGPVECAVAGEGPTILALHGGMGGHDQSWLLARSLLADPQGYRIVAPSRPGYLGTPLRVGRAPEDQADAYADLLDALGIPTVAVAAVSAGGPSALQFALRHPARCWGLVLVSACSGRLATPPAIIAQLRVLRLVALVPGLAAIMRRRAERNPQNLARRSIADPLIRERTLNHPVAGALLRALQLGIFDRLRQRLPGTINDTTRFAGLDAYPIARLAVPVLVVHGKADRVVSFAHAEAVAGQVPHAALMAIENGEHVALFTHLDEVRTRAARFLAQHRP